VHPVDSIDMVNLPQKKSCS